MTPRSSIPQCTGPSLYMWLLWLVPLPAFIKEVWHPMSREDLCMLTVYGPAKTAHASPFSTCVLAKNSESWAENCFSTEAPCPMKQLRIIAPESSRPSSTIKFSAFTPAPTYARGLFAVELFIIIPLRSDSAPSTVTPRPTATFISRPHRSTRALSPIYGATDIVSK